LNGYSSLVIDHFERPRNVGLWTAAEQVASQGVVQGSAGSIAQGVQFLLSARVAGGCVQSARFQAYGCPHCIASASWLTEQLPGCSTTTLGQWQWREVARVLQVPAEKYGRLLILEDALRRLVEDWGRKL